MKVKAFLDASVLVAVLNKEFPEYTYAARVLSLANKDQFELYTSPLCLAIAFYFASKKSGDLKAKKKIQLLNEHLSLAGINQRAVQQAIANPEINDLEDGFQYYAAVEAGCQCIVTANLQDFYFGRLEVLTSEQFILQKAVKPNKKGAH